MAQCHFVEWHFVHPLYKDSLGSNTNDLKTEPILGWRSSTFLMWGSGTRWNLSWRTDVKSLLEKHLSYSSLSLRSWQNNYCWKIGVLPNGLTHIGTEVSGTDLCANIDVISYSSKLVLKVSNKKMNLVAGCVMEGSMVFCQKNILEHSMSFHGDCIKRCLHRVSQIL